MATATKPPADDPSEFWAGIVLAFVAALLAYAIVGMLILFSLGVI